MHLLRLLLLLLPLTAVAASAQSARQLYNQDRLADLLYANRDSVLDAIPEVTYRDYVLHHESGNGVLARHELFMEAGNGDATAGRDRLDMVAFLNGVVISDLGVGDTLILPSHFELDARAYSPFPRQWAGGEGFEKLFVIHKTVQAWAAYENGRLERWGLVSTGADESETPNGRFNFNWKEQHRISTLSPPGQEWHMRWVFNFFDERGIHVHQYYALPTAGAASHGCVRLMTADARWIYDWADGWVTSNGTAARGLASRGRILRQGTIVLVLGEQPPGAPERFRRTDAGPELVTVALPDDPYSIPPGSPQQRTFDQRRRAARTAS
jgi:hypothetical protein